MTEIVRCTVPLTSGFSHVLFNLKAQGYGLVRFRYFSYGNGNGLGGFVLLKNDAFAVERNDAGEFSGIRILNSMIDSKMVPEHLLCRTIEQKMEPLLKNLDGWYSGTGCQGRVFILTDSCEYLIKHEKNIIARQNEQAVGILND